MAAMLNVSEGRLVWHAYRSDPAKRYRSFTIQKKNGESRQIDAPVPGLKLIQRELADLFQSCYRPRKCVTGFVAKRSIKSNADFHVGKRWVLNLDLKDFFPTISFPRVRGLFLRPPYSLPERVATIIAQLCCYNGHLPQGAPTSPVLANMICSKLDSELLHFARSHRCTYSRYADDITFSSQTPMFPEMLAVCEFPGLGGSVSVSQALSQVIKANWFDINDAKTRLQNRSRRQVVTGLVVNRKANVKKRFESQIRAMLHAWERWELKGAQTEFIAKFDKRATTRSPMTEEPKFEDVVAGKIEFLRMIKGDGDPAVLRFKATYRSLSQEL